MVGPVALRPATAGCAKRAEPTRPMARAAESSNDFIFSLTYGGGEKVRGIPRSSMGLFYYNRGLHVRMVVAIIRVGAGLVEGVGVAPALVELARMPRLVVGRRRVEDGIVVDPLDALTGRDGDGLGIEREVVHVHHGGGRCSGRRRGCGGSGR